MKLHHFFIASHTVAAAVAAALMVAAFQSGTTNAMIGAAALSLVVSAAVSWFIAGRIRAGLVSLESVVSDHEQAQTLASDLAEFSQSAQRIGNCAQRWETVAANSRQQAREFQSMIMMLNRRGATGEPSSGQLRSLLAGLGNALHAQLQQIERGTAEMQQCTQTITDGAEEQRHVVIKTITYVEQLSSAIDSVAGNADSAKTAIEQTNKSASEAQNVVRELIDGMTRIRTQSQASEKKLRGLSDPSQQISAIVATISDIAARTDLLALNASIESIRAGEHGRGFAIVADEVRKLAEQASDATREISSLIDSMQLVTQESIGGFVRDREQIENQVERAATAQRALQQISGLSEGASKHILQVAESSTQQLHLAQDVVLAVEQISKIAKAHRGSAESAGWTMKSLSDSTPQFSHSIDRLRSCAGESTIESHVSDEATAIAPVVLQAMPESPSLMTPVS